MDENDWLAERFEAHRQHLRGVAFRMLGSATEADDAVQEAWIRLSRADVAAVDNLGGWLTTVVARVSLDMLRSQHSRQEDLSDDVDLTSVGDQGQDPADQAVLVDSVSSALLIVLDTLDPAERLAFVLHDSFGVPFDEVAAILDRSAGAAKQLAHRARQKVRGIDPGVTVAARQHAVIEAFLAASRSGDLDALIELLHPEVVLRADAAGVAMGSPERTDGATAVAATFSGRALAATVALVDGLAGMMWAVNGRTKVVWNFTVQDGVIIAIDMIADSDHLASLELGELR